MKRNGLHSAVRSFAALVLALGCLAPVAVAQQKTTTSQGNGNWNAIAWDNGAPAAGDTVIINHTVTNSASTPDLAELNVNAAKTLVCSGWDTVVSAAVVNVNGTITHADNWSATTNASGEWIPMHRIHIVCSNLTVAATTGKILADQMGFARAGSSTSFNGPGGGVGPSGGGYGGKGGLGYNGGGAPGGIYGSATAPEDPGSGGGNREGWGQGTHGGGAIRIIATGDVVVNGAITANGGDSVTPGGRGSGGSIWVTCNTIQGSGTVSANGGAAYLDAGGGGGGRIAVDYHQAAQSNVSCSVVFSAWASPTGKWYENFNRFGLRPDARSELGTLSFPDSQIFPRTTMLGVSGVPVIPGFTAWTPSSLTISNGWVMFPSNFTLTVGGDVLIQGSSGRLEFDAGTTCNVGGNLLLTNGGSLSAFCGETPTNTAASILVEVAGDVTIPTNCWIYAYSHPTNGGSALFRMRNLTIAGGGGINADGKGYRGWKAGDPGWWGYGPGAGYESYGGGYGGMGGRGIYSTPPPGYGMYGSSNAPVYPGSGGGRLGGYSLGGGNGGGLIRIEATAGMTVDGTITANGQQAVNIGATPGHAAGSGGGVSLRCQTFAGAGIVRANGGSGNATAGNGGGAGGGGRVAIWRVYDTSTLSVLSADAGAGGFGAPYATDGTVVLGQLSPSGTLITIR